MRNRKPFFAHLEAIVSADTEFQQEWARLRAHHSAATTYRLLSDRYSARNDAVQRLLNCLREPTRSFLAGDEDGIETIIDFIEIDIPAFRAGYIKEYYYRKLKNTELSPLQIKRLQNYAMTLLKRPAYRREWRELSRLLIIIADQDMLDNLHHLATVSDDERIRQRALHTVEKILNSREDLQGR